MKMLEGGDYDLLIQDLQRPSVDGLELYRLMKGHPRLSNTPVLLLTMSEAAYLDQSGETIANGLRFKGTFQATFTDAHRKSAGTLDYLGTPVNFFVEGYLCCTADASCVVSAVEKVREKRDAMENLETEFRLRNEFLWPEALRSLIGES